MGRARGGRLLPSRGSNLDRDARLRGWASPAPGLIGGRLIAAVGPAALDELITAIQEVAASAD